MSETTETDDEQTKTESKQVTETKTEIEKETETGKLTKGEQAHKILSLVIEWMRVAADLKGKSGAEKKKFVLKQVRDELKLDDILEDFILAVIDLLIDIDKNGLRINPIAKKGLRLLCC